MGAQNTSSLSLGSFHKYPYPLPLPQWNNDLYNLHNLKFSPTSYVNVNSLTPSRKLEQRKGIIPVGGDEKGGGGGGMTANCHQSMYFLRCSHTSKHIILWVHTTTLWEGHYYPHLRDENSGNRKGRSHYCLRRLGTPPNMICVGPWCLEWVSVAFLNLFSL